MGSRIEQLKILDPRWCEPQRPSTVSKAVKGRKICELGRRGKYIFLELEGEAYLVMHLRMTGTLLYGTSVEPAHTRVQMTLEGGSTLLFVDPRRFGTGQVFSDRVELEQFFEFRLGMEPFAETFTADHFVSLTRGSRTAIKAFLLDQRKVAGVGNIYADEALFRARIHPAHPAGRIKRERLELLHGAVLDALAAGIEARGATIDDFRHVDGARGSFQDRFLVHRRADKPCPECETTIVKTRVAQRGTYFCPNCQRPPRSR